MVVNHTSRRTRGTLPTTTSQAAWKWVGYNDKMMGLEYRKEYETLNQHLQRNYELGRAIATIVLAELGRPIAWRQTEMMSAAFNRAGIRGAEMGQLASTLNAEVDYRLQIKGK